ELENSLEQYQRRFQQLSKDYNNYVSQLEEEVTLLKRMRLKDAFVERIQKQDYDSQYLSEQLFDIRNDLNEKRTSNMERVVQVDHELTQRKDKKHELNKQMELLKRNRFLYRKEVSELIQILSLKLEEYFMQKVDVKPLCEYLEVTDESWRRAIE